MRLAALLAIAFCACVHGLPPSSVDAHAVSAVEGAWRASGLPGPGDCLELVEVRRHDSVRGFDDECAGATPGVYREQLAQHGRPAGCLTSALRGMLGRRVWIVELAPGYHTDSHLVQHELLHALTTCNLRRTYSDPFDAGHSDPRIWEGASRDPDVRAASVQARARLVGVLDRGS